MEIGFSFCDEIEEEIMLRLPTKSLSRFKCVSKTWYTRITSSEFAHKHLKHQRQTQSNNLNLMLHGSGGPLQSVSCSSIYYDDNDIKTTKHHDQPQPLLLDHKFNVVFNVVGSCDGLLLVVATVTGGFGIDYVIYIWNPTTGEYKTLPEQLMEYYVYTNFVLGFGPDLTTDSNNHYKVLLFETARRGGSESEFKVNIYTTHTNSWKVLLPNFSACGYFSLHPQRMILAYDNLHYRALIDTTEDDPECIISFDLKDDKFRVLPKPHGRYFINLCALNADLCAFSITDDKYTIYCLWRMENFGVKKQECWTKMCSIDCRIGMDYPIKVLSALHFLEDGQILLYAQRKNLRQGQPFIIAYNTENKRASFLVQGNGSFMSIPVVYEESFISPNAARLHC